MSSYYCENSFDLAEPLSGSQGPTGAPTRHFATRTVHLYTRHCRGLTCPPLAGYPPVFSIVQTATALSISSSGFMSFINSSLNFRPYSCLPHLGRIVHSIVERSVYCEFYISVLPLGLPSRLEQRREGFHKCSCING